MAGAAPPQPIYVGCAGWSVPKDHAVFPTGSSHLERYAGRFPAVEINTSFSHRHRDQRSPVPGRLEHGAPVRVVVPAVVRAGGPRGTVSGTVQLERTVPASSSSSVAGQ